MSTTPSSPFEGSSTCPIPMDNLIEDMDVAIENEDISPQKGQEEENVHEEKPVDPPFQRKKQKKTADCWKEMNSYTENGVQMAECKYCTEKLRVNKTSTTTQFNRHLASCLQRKIKLGQNTTLKQQVLAFSPSEEGSSLNNFVYDHARVRELAAHMLLVHEYPFAMMEHAIFNNFMKACSPFYQKISRNSVKQDCRSTYEVEKKKIKTLLHKVNRISITTDLWKSVQNIQYMVVTGHFIDSNWMLQKRVLSFKNIPPPHTGIIVADGLSKSLLDWGIEDKLASITVDNAAYNDVCIRRLKGDLLLRKCLPLEGKLFHVRCCAHILNLLVQDGLRHIEDVIEVVRKGIKYIRSSEARCNDFSKIVKQIQLPCKKLILDCPTRWNGTYLMLAAALEVKDVFSRYQDIDPGFSYVPDAYDWMKVEGVTQFLGVFHEITNLISGSDYPTANLFLPELYRIKELLNEKLLDSCSNIRGMAQAMTSKFDKYWGECNLLFSFSAILDPRYKMKLIEFSFPVLYQEASDVNIELVKKELYELYETYVTAHNDLQLHKERNVNKRTRPDNIQVGNGSSEVIGRVVVTGKSKFDSFVRQGGEKVKAQKSDLDIYLEEDVLICDSAAQFNAIEWWMVNQIKYPRLSKMAADVLAIPITTVASESTFSAGGRVIDNRRASMSVETVEMLLCASDWVRNIHGLKNRHNRDPEEDLHFEEVDLI